MSEVTLEDLQSVLRRILKSPDGEILFKHLDAKYYDCKFKDENLARQTGRRDVLLYIKQLTGE